MSTDKASERSISEMQNEPPRFAWEEDTDEVDELLWDHGYTRVRGFEGVWCRGADGPPLTRAQALEEIAKRMDSDE
jgi:hypothetical protein